MKILQLEQGTPEWMQARSGRPTASCFDKIVTSKGEPSTQRKKYLYQLAGERIIGTKEEGYSNAIMQRGVELESTARQLYEFVNDVEVQQVGMCLTDDEKVSCSPDGLMVKSGLEIKCPTLPVHVEYLLGGKLPTTYVQQVQGSMFVTGYDRWDFVSFYPEMPPLMLRVRRDEKFISKLESALREFCDELDATTEKLRIAA